MVRSLFKIVTFFGVTGSLEKMKNLLGPKTKHSCQVKRIQIDSMLARNEILSFGVKSIENSFKSCIILQVIKICRLLLNAQAK